MGDFFWSIAQFLIENFWLTLILSFLALVIARIVYRFYHYGLTWNELRYILKRSPFYFIVLFFCLFAVIPFMFMFLHTFKTDADLYRRPNPFIFRQPPTLEHLDTLFNNTDYLYFIRNSFIVGVAVVVITLILAVPAAYALARLTGRWGERAGILMFLVYLVPPTLLFIPMFRIVVLFGLKDSLLSLILIYPTITVPFSVWLLQGFFKAIPPELEEAALVDGHNRVGAFLLVVMPLSLPGIISTIVFTFTLTLHEFIYALVFISNTQQRTLSVGVPTQLILGDVYFWQPLLAAALIIAIPVGLAYNWFLDSLVQGFTMGAVKG
jgi:multiple sugar transport system permease protein